MPCAGAMAGRSAAGSSLGLDRRFILSESQVCGVDRVAPTDAIVTGSALRYGETHTLPAETKSTFCTSVRSRIGAHPAFFGGLARNSSRYWFPNRRFRLSR